MDRTSKNIEELSWKQSALKQGYLIKFQRGLLKVPKMQYFVLTANGLISFNGKPDDDTKPLSFLPYEELSSIKLDHIELNSCKLCCMQLTSKTSSSFVLGFNKKEDRDEWMMIMMKSFSEALLSTRVFAKTPSPIDEDKATSNEDFTTAKITERTTSTSSYGQSLRRKRRKGDRGSIRRSKSHDALALHDVTNTAFNFPTKNLPANPLRPEAEKPSFSESRKRKSEPNIHVISHFPNAWTSDKLFDSKEKIFASACSFEHRDSLTVQAEKQLKAVKHDAKPKSNMFSKLRSKLEHPVRYAH